MPDSVEPQTWVPEACTLPTVEQPLRVAAFDVVLGRAVRAVEETGPAGVRLHLHRNPEGIGQVASLLVQEAECCDFFRFTLVVAADVLALDVMVPPAQAAVLAALSDRLRR